MAYVRPQHPNAALNARQRRKMVALVLDQRWTVEAAARQFQVDAKTVRKWRDRFAAEGEAGLHDRSSRPRRSPNATQPAKRAEVIRLRLQRRWGADRIGHEAGLAGSAQGLDALGDVGKAWIVLGDPGEQGP